MKMERTPYDNDITFRRKKAYQLGVLFSYTYYDGEKYQSILQFIRDQIENEVTLTDIFDQLFNYDILITNDDLIMAYTYVAVTLGHNISDVYDVITRSNLNEDPEKEVQLYTKLEDFNGTYNLWINEWNVQIQKETSALQKILNDQQKLSILEPVTISQIIRNKVKSQYSVRWKDGSEINPIDGIEIFAKSIPTIQIPFIQYNDSDNKSYIRLYEKDVPIKTILQNSSVTIKKDTIYLTAHISKGDFSDNKKAYIRCIYNITKGYISFEYLTSYFDIAVFLQRLSESFPLLDFYDFKSTKIGANFNLINVAIEELYFYYMVINDFLIRTYLYIDEKNKPWCEKSKIKYHYYSYTGELDDEEEGSRLPASISLYFGSDETFLEESTEETLTVSKNTPVSIFAQSQEILDNFIYIFVRLIRSYLNEFQSVKELFRRYLSVEEKPTTPSKPKSKKREAKDSKKRDIDDLLDEVFKDVASSAGKNYSVMCQCPKQPIVIGQDEVEEWREKMFFSGGQLTPRSVMNFPYSKDPKLSKLYFVCPTDEQPYPAFQENFGVNADDIPYVPCCQKNPNISEEQQERMFHEQKGKAAETRKSKEIRKAISKTTKTIETTDVVSTRISVILNQGKPDEYIFHRVTSSTSSIIHCVLTAINDQNYLREGENYVKRVRQQIGNEVNSEVYKQELYDMSPDEIKANILNDEIFLDPYLYYRGIEEHFNVNIFVFISPEESNQVTGKPSTISTLEVPRCQLAHIRPFRSDRYTLIIYKTSSKNIVKCDLIIGRSSPTILFDNNMAKVLFDTLRRSLKSHTFQGISLDRRDDPWINWVKILSRNDVKLLSQKIDTYGKLRVINLKFKDNNMSIVVYPSQPLNLPTSNEIYTSTEEIVRLLLGNPSGILSNGLWFKIYDYIFGIYVPCNTSSPPTDAPISPIYQGNQIVDYKGPIYTIRVTQRWASILIQIINWLWKLENRPLFRQWWEKYAHRIDMQPQIPINISRFLPTNNNSLDGIRYMSTQWPQYFRNDGMYFYHALYDKLYNFFIREETMTEDLNDDVPIRLEGIYVWKDDFPQYPNTDLFIGKEDYNLWIAYNLINTGMEVYNGFNYVADTLAIEFANRIQPYFYQNNDNIYLIQNVHKGEFQRAVNVCFHWYSQKINIGRDAQPATQSYPLVIYDISKKGTIIPTQSNIQGGEFLQILHYSENSYAAILKLY